MVVKSTTNRILLSVMVVALSLYAGGNVHAVTSITDVNTVDSALNGFNPATNLLPAATRTNPALGPCFSCPNVGAPDAGNTTAGSLTDNMNGIIRLNNNANVGQLGRTPVLQGQSGIPAGGNDASAFTVTINTPGLNDLGAFGPTGTTVTNPNPANDLNGNPLGAVGTAGMRMDFSTSFTFNPGVGSSSTQSVEQATFTGSQDGNSVQLVREIASMVASTPNLSAADENNVVVVNWNQTIQEGGFLLSNNLGTFGYNGGGGLFPLAAAPTGPGQSAGLAPTCIGQVGHGTC